MRGWPIEKILSHLVLIGASWKRQELFHHLKSRLAVKRASWVDRVAITSSRVLSIFNCVLDGSSFEHVVDDWVLRNRWNHRFDLVSSSNTWVVISRADEVTNCFLHAGVWVDVMLSHEVIQSRHQVGNSCLIVVWGENSVKQILLKTRQPLTSVVSASSSCSSLAWKYVQDLWQNQQSSNSDQSSQNDAAKINWRLAVWSPNTSVGAITNRISVSCRQAEVAEVAKSLWSVGSCSFSFISGLPTTTPLVVGISTCAEGDDRSWSRKIFRKMCLSSPFIRLILLRHSIRRVANEGQDNKHVSESNYFGEIHLWFKNLLQD